MKKGKVILAIAMFGVITFITTLNIKNNQMSDLILNNVESLAGSEGSGGEELGKYLCYRDGSVDCPDGTKAEMVIEIMSL